MYNAAELELTQRVLINAARTIIPAGAAVTSVTALQILMSTWESGASHGVQPV